MALNPNKQKTNRKKRTDTASIIAGIAKKSPRLVNMVMNGQVENEKILTATILYEQKKNQLIKEIERLITFN